MNRLFKKHTYLQRFTACFLLLYLVHDFSITSLIAYNHSESNTSVNTSISCKNAHKGMPAKNNSRPYSWFIAKHLELKFERLTENNISVPIGSVELPYHAPNKFISYYSSPTFCLRDDAYKRYRLFGVFLV